MFGAVGHESQQWNQNDVVDFNFGDTSPINTSLEEIESPEVSPCVIIESKKAIAIQKLNRVKFELLVRADSCSESSPTNSYFVLPVYLSRRFYSLENVNLGSLQCSKALNKMTDIVQRTSFQHIHEDVKFLHELGKWSEKCLCAFVEPCNLSVNMSSTANTTNESISCDMSNQDDVFGSAICPSNNSEEISCIECHTIQRPRVESPVAVADMSNSFMFRREPYVDNTEFNFEEESYCSPYSDDPVSSPINCVFCRKNNQDTEEQQSEPSEEDPDDTEKQPVKSGEVDVDIEKQPMKPNASTAEPSVKPAAVNENISNPGIPVATVCVGSLSLAVFIASLCIHVWQPHFFHPSFRWFKRY